MYYVYILTNKTDTVMYIGVTNDLHRRLYEHKNEQIEGFTKKYSLARVILSGAKRNRTFSSEIPNDATHRLILAMLGFRLRSG